MNRIFLVLVLLFTAMQTKGAIITLDFEDGVDPAVNIVGSFGRLDPISNNGYDVLANYTSSDFVGFSFGGAGSELRFESTDGLFELIELSMIGAWGTQTATLRGYQGDFATQSIDVELDRFNVDQLILGWTDLTAFSIVTGTDYVNQPGHSCCGGGNSPQIAFDNIMLDILAGTGPDGSGGGDGSGGTGGSDNNGGSNGNGGSSGNGDNGGSGGNDPVAVSEPSSILLLSLGLAGLCYSRREKKA